MRFYLAATVSRWREHNIVRDILVAGGHECTCDWTLYGTNSSLRGHSPAEWALAAQRETEGIRTAQFFVGLLPGGIGTNAEVGMSSLMQIPTFLHTTDPKLFDCGPDGKTTTFYWHNQARRFQGCSIEEFAEKVLIRVAKDVEKHSYLGHIIPVGLRHLEDDPGCGDCPVGGRDGKSPLCPRSPLCDWECGVQVMSLD